MTFDSKARGVAGPASERPYPARGQAYHVVGILLFAWIAAFMDRMVFNLVLPAIRHDMQVSDTMISLSQGIAFTLFYTAAAIPIGALVDRLNRRNLLVAGIGIWSLMTIACGLATSVGQLFAARVGLGVGEACLVPASLSLIADYFAPTQRGRAIGLVYMGAPVGSALSGLGGGLLLHLLGDGPHVLPILGLVSTWRMVFLCMGLPGVLAALFLCTVAEPPRRHLANSSARPAPASAVARHIASQAAAYGYVTLAISMVCAAGMALSSWGSVFLMRRYNLPPATVGLTLGLAMLVTGPFGSPIGGFISDLMVRRRPLDGRLLVNFVVVLPLIVMVGVVAGQSFGVALVAQAISLMVIGLSVALGFSLIQDITPPPLIGRLIGIYQLLVYMVGGLAPTAVALMTDRVFHRDDLVGYSLMLICGVSLTLALLATLLGLGPYRKARQAILGEPPQSASRARFAGSPALKSRPVAGL